MRTGILLLILVVLCLLCMGCSSSQTPAETPKATLEITSSPSGANIYIDGNYKGETPKTISLNPETVEVKLQKEGYKEFSKFMNLSSGSNYVIDAQLSLEPTQTPIATQTPTPRALPNYDIQHRVGLQEDFTPVMEVSVIGEPGDLKVDLASPNDVRSKTISKKSFTDQMTTIKFTLSEPGVVPTTGSYEITIKSQGEVVSSKSFNLEGYNLVVQDAEFDVSGNTLKSTTLTLKNEGDIPVFIQRADIKVGNQDPKGWLSTRGIAPQEVIELNIPQEFNLDGDTNHINVWLYHQGDLVSSYETSIS